MTDAISSEKYRGIVILHGTDTLEYTAAALYCTAPPVLPVILTGSMLPFGADGSDALRNLSDALICADDERFAGVYVVFAGRVIGGGEAVKLRSDSADAFRSFSGSDCGSVTNGKAVLSRGSVPEKLLTFPKRERRVAAVRLSPFTRAEELELIGYDAAVLESRGAGGLPERLTAAAKALAERMPVIMTTSCIGGARLDEYEVGRRAKALGIADGGKMTAALAAVKLFLADEETK